MQTATSRRTRGSGSCLFSTTSTALAAKAGSQSGKQPSVCKVQPDDARRRVVGHGLLSVRTSQVGMQRAWWF